MRRNFTKEEIEYIEDVWGTVSVPYIAKKLKRTETSVKLKAYRLGLGDPRTAGNDVTLVQFTEISGIPYRTVGAWIETNDFPVKLKRFYKQRVKYVELESFWKWAETHKHCVDLTKFKKGDLGIEPDWAEQKRKDDYITKQYRRKKHNDAWTTSEDNQLRFLIQKNYTYPELAKLFGRGEQAIRRRLDTLGIKFRPTRLNNHIKYTAEEIELIVKGISQGRSIESIAYQIGKSANGVRGKLERMGYKFKCGVPYLPEAN